MVNPQILEVDFQGDIYLLDLMQSGKIKHGTGG